MKDKTKKALKVFLLTFIINAVVFLLQNLFVGVVITKGVLIIIALTSLVESFLLDKFVIQDGII